MQDHDTAATAQRIAAHFRRPWHRDYSRWKLRLDPAYSAAASAIGSEGAMPLLDVGCGLGLLGFYLREHGFRGDYLGIDFDAGKIEAAREAAEGAGIRLDFESGDAAGLPPFEGHVALLDVLHYLPAESQRTLLRDAAARVAPGATLIVRNVLRQPGWRFRLTVWEERFMHAVRWMRSAAVHYPSREEIEAPLREAGLVADVRPLWGRTPFNSFAIVARRPA